MQTLDQSLSLEDPLEKEKATHSSILAWRIPWTVQSIGSQESDTTEWLSLHMLKIQFYFLSCDVTIFFTLFFNLVCWSLSYRLRGTVYFEYLWYELQIYFSQVAVFFFFLAALGLRCSEGAFSNCTLHRASLVVVCRRSRPAHECPCGIFVPWPGIESSALALEGRFLTTGPPGKFLQVVVF